MPRGAMCAMSRMHAPAKAQMAEITAVVIRADGTREELGRLAYYHKNPFKNAWGNLRIRINELRRKF